MMSSIRLLRVDEDKIHKIRLNERGQYFIIPIISICQSLLIGITLLDALARGGKIALTRGRLTSTWHVFGTVASGKACRKQTDYLPRVDFLEIKRTTHRPAGWPE